MVGYGWLLCEFDSKYPVAFQSHCLLTERWCVGMFTGRCNNKEVARTVDDKCGWGTADASVNECQETEGAIAIFGALYHIYSPLQGYNFAVW